MEVTRRYWTIAGLSIILAAWGVIINRPLVLLGSGGVAAWLISHQYRFVRAAGTLPDGLTVNLTADRQVMAEETTQISLDGSRSQSLSYTVEISVEPPVGVSGESASLTLEPGERRDAGFTTLTWPVAGLFVIDDVTATLSDGRNIFRQRIDLETGVTVEVEPRAPRNIHIGEGGQPVAVGFGEHETGHLGSGIEPAEIREYAPGDSVRQIDWKATARHDQAHVREFEGETDRETRIFFDLRASMGTGREETRKLDYARQLALALVNYARQADDELGYYALGNEGLTEIISPDMRTETWRPIREHLLDATTTGSDDSTAGLISPARVRAKRARLENDSSVFGQTLTPFFSDRHAYRQRFDELPLYSAMTNSQVSSTGIAWTVIITDDSKRAELRETVKYARKMADHVTVFLTPSVLFDESEFPDLDRAYNQYIEFENYRRELSRLGQVSAYEVGPADRLSAILSVNRGTRMKEGA